MKIDLDLDEVTVLLSGLKTLRENELKALDDLTRDADLFTAPGAFQAQADCIHGNVGRLECLVTRLLNPDRAQSISDAISEVLQEMQGVTSPGWVN